jgi:hypothetical protein
MKHLVLRLLPVFAALSLAAQVVPPGRTAVNSPYPVAQGRTFTTTTQLDILMAYTPAALSYAGGSSAMRAAIHSHIALANRCYVNSDMPITLRPVGIVQTGYTEAANFNDDLTRLQNSGDGVMDELHTTRNTRGADLVALIRRNSAAGVAGLAYVNTGNGDAGFAPYAMSVTADIWASGNIAFPHEIGHNLGCWHDRGNSSGATHAYAYGWRFYGTDNIQYITVMAYYPGTRIPYFSNPTINYQGTPTGVATGSNAADNALRHEVTAAGSASYRALGTTAGSGVRGDFNGDGVVDLVLQNPSTGERALWLMSGATRNQNVVLATGATAWQVALVADMNTDGHPDIVFQNTSTGERSIWLMSGTARASVFTLPTGALAWQMAAAGDFNADGKTDLVYQNTSTGERCIWLMNGTARLSVFTLPTGALAWQIAAAGDFNADGKPDLVYQNTSTGERCIWLMNGTARLSVVNLPAGTTAWRIAAAGDLNADAKPDLVFQNTGTGELSVWYMNGTTRGSTASLPAPASSAWRVSNR